MGEHFAGLQILFTPAALTESEERLFPPSKNRSARIRKKLIKRFGGEFRKVPAMWRVGDRVFAHPDFRREVERLRVSATGEEKEG